MQRSLRIKRAAMLAPQIVVVGDSVLQETVRYENVDRHGVFPVCRLPKISRAVYGATTVASMAFRLGFGCHAITGYVPNRKSYQIRTYIDGRCVLCEDDDILTPTVVSDALAKTINRAPLSAGSAIVFDLGKGVVTENLWWSAVRRWPSVPILVRPHYSRDSSFYGGAYCVCLNAEDDPGDYPFAERKIVVDARKSILTVMDGQSTHQFACGQMLDESGAEEQVIATLAAMLNGGADFIEAARRASVALGMQLTRESDEALRGVDLWDNLNERAREIIQGDNHAGNVIAVRAGT